MKINNQRFGKGLAYCLTLSGIFTATFVDCAFAQTNAIVPDNTLGNNPSRVEPFDSDPTTDVITGGVLNGTNLFHSFREFNVGEGRSVFFLSPNSNVQNILARVTGTNVSKILGVLGTFQRINGNVDVSNANLFLINPNGIIIGPNAIISVGGSFVGSTANGIEFAEGKLFSATAPQATPLLTVTAPIGLQFGINPKDILVQQSAIQVSPGKTVALVGGNVTLDNNYSVAPGGQIAIGGILEPGTIGLNLESNNLPLSFPQNTKLADVTFKNLSFMDVNDEGGGHIQVQGGLITLSEGSLLTANTLGSQNGRGIFIQGKQLTLKDGSQIRTSTRSTGDAGSLTVKAADSVQIIGTDADGNPSALFAETTNLGKAGNINVEARNLIVEGGGNISITSRPQGGSGGNLTVTAFDSIKLSGTNNFNNNPSGLFAQTLGNKDAGSLTINTRQLIVQNGAQVTAGTGNGSRGNGGSLTVNATDSIQLSGTGKNGQTRSGLFARSRGTGNAGSLKIVTGQLTVQDKATVTVESLGLGNAGNLDIEASSVRLNQQGTITAATTSGRGGNISLRNLNSLLLQGNSQITTTADTSQLGKDVAGGNIDIDSKLIVATSKANSDITANAFKGRGGNINITTDGLFGIAPFNGINPEKNITNDITAASKLGINGKIQINSPDVEPNSGIVELPAEVVDASQAIAQGCSSSNSKTRSEIMITGRGGLPPTPDEPLSSDIVWSDTRLNAITRPASSSHQITTKLTSLPQTVEIVPATSWVFNQQGEVTLIAHTANVAPYSLGKNSSSCPTNNPRI